MVYVPSNTTKGRISVGLSLQSKGLSIWNSNASCSFMFPIKKPHILHVIPPCLESLSARGLRFDNALRRRRRSSAPAAANPARKRSRTPQSLGSCWDGWDGGWFSGDPWGDPWLSHWQPIDMWVSKSLLTHLKKHDNWIQCLLLHAVTNFSVVGTCWDMLGQFAWRHLLLTLSVTGWRSNDIVWVLDAGSTDVLCEETAAVFKTSQFWTHRRDS